MSQVLHMIGSEILGFYGDGTEEHRLARSLGRLERIRTWEIMDRHLSPAPANILDVGGGTGVYALPLAARGHRVHLIDPVPLHVERARELSRASESSLVSAEIGDARRLDLPSSTFDVVLLLGPLYHLPAGRDRLDALAEARRVLVPGGLLLSSHISRFASMCDMMQDGRLRGSVCAALVDRTLTDGVHQNADGTSSFTTAYFQRPDEIRREIEDAGLQFEDVIAVEGPGWVCKDLDSWLDDHEAREHLLRFLRRVECEPSLIGASPHLIAICHK